VKILLNGRISSGCMGVVFVLVLVGLHGVCQELVRYQFFGGMAEHYYRPPSEAVTAVEFSALGSCFAG